MTDSISIRRARIEDHAELRLLLSELDRLHTGGVPWMFRTAVFDFRSREWLEARLASDSDALFVADEGKCIGLAGVGLRQAPNIPIFISQQHAVIDDVIVHPDHRRRGIGGRLCEACEDWARARDARWVELRVYDFNDDAYDFYTALGYRTAARTMVKK